MDYCISLQSCCMFFFRNIMITSSSVCWHTGTNLIRTQSSVLHCWFVFRRSQGQILTWRPAIQTELFHGFSQSIQTNASVGCQARPWQFPATVFLNHCSPIILAFETPVSFSGSNQVFGTLETNSSVCSINTRRKHHLHRPTANLSCFQKNAFYAGVIIFNSWPHSFMFRRNEKE